MTTVELAELIRTGAATPRRFSVAEYHRLVETGILGEDDRVELLEGVITEMTPQSVPRARVIQRLDRTMTRALPDELVVRVQLPLTLSDDSEPEPDLAVVTAEEANAGDRHPSHPLLVIEVAGESLRSDRAAKGAIYARAGIPEYWIADLAGRRIEVHTEPDAALGRYRTLRTFGPGGAVAATSVPGVQVELDALFA